MCWQKALSDERDRELDRIFVRGICRQVRWFVDVDDDSSFSLNLQTARGAVLSALQSARLSTRCRDARPDDRVDEWDRRFRELSGVRRIDDDERDIVDRRVRPLPRDDSRDQALPWHRLRRQGPRRQDRLRYRQRRSPRVHRADRRIQPGARQRRGAVDEAGQRGRAQPGGRRRDVHEYFKHHGHRTAVSQRALQAHADPLLGYTDIDGIGFVVSEISPYDADLDWGELTEPDELAEVIEQLGQAVAKVHCVSDTDSDQSLVDFQTEEAIVEVIGREVDDFVTDMVSFGLEYAAMVRDDHRHSSMHFGKAVSPASRQPD